MSLAKQAQRIENNLSEFWEDDDSAFAIDMAMAKDKEDKEDKEEKEEEDEGPGAEIEAILVEEDDGLEGIEGLGDLEIVKEDEDDEEEEDGSILQIEEVGDDRPVQAFTFSMPPIPGSELEDADIDELSVDEPEEEVEIEERDPWDWAGVGLGQFMTWLQSMLAGIPPHSGNDISGIERAKSFLEELDKIISKAVRSDLRNELDIQQIDMARRSIRDGIKRLQDRYDRLTAGAKRNKKAELQESLVKEAQKITGVGHVVVTVPLLISRIARVCINGMVSAGHDMEDMFDRQAKAYSLDKREQAELLQLLEDMGYPMRRDRGFLRDEQIDTTRSDNFDWAANYPG